MKNLAAAAESSMSHGGVWPTEAQQLLLRAALLDAPAAIDAFTAWADTAPTDALDPASWKLIPLVHVNLKRVGAVHPLLPQARECHRFSWGSNQKLFHQTAAFLGEMRQAGIPTLVLKGVALAHLYYPDTAARPMADLDILVPAAHFLKLGRQLLDAGWKETDGHPFATFQMDLMPSFGFMRPDGFCVDIHCHVLHADCGARADEEFWAHARPWTLRQTPALALSHEDQLLHVISHGVRWCDVPPFRWIPDAWWVLARSRAEFDWDRFCVQARLHQVHLSILRGLELADNIAPLNLPAGLLGCLDSIPVSAQARVRYIVYTNPLPAAFFARAGAIWKIVARGDADRPVLGASTGERRGMDPRLIPSLLIFAIKVVIRDRKQLLAALLAWITGSEPNRDGVG